MFICLFVYLFVYLFVCCSFIVGSDYSGDNSVTLTLDSDNLRQCTTYMTIADTDIEEDESFIATLSSVDIRVVLTNPVETTVNIIDNDCKVVFWCTITSVYVLF